jgi:DNA-directed RNA polymerase specialized sigma24 family protein
MDKSSAQAVPGGDAELIRAVASGDAAAYVGLHERHVAAARSLAGLVVADPAEAEQVLSEAFTRLRDALRRGTGPQEALRPYLLTAVRRVARERIDAGRADAGRPGASQPAAEPAERVEPAQAAEPAEPAKAAAGQPDLGEPLLIDPAIADLAGTPLARAFMSLPDRWRAALWHTAIEQAAPADVAAILGLTAEGAAELDGQARAGLIRAALMLQRSGLTREDCTAAVSGLDADPDGTLTGFDDRPVQAHLRGCRECRAAAFELADLGRSLRRVVAPIILGSATAAYLARGGASAGPAGRAAAAGVTSGLTSGVTSGLRRMGQAPRRIGRVPRQQRVLAGGGLLLAAFAVTGLALLLTAGGQPQASPHQVAAAGPSPTPASRVTPAPSSAPAPSRHRAATTSRIAQPARSVSPTPSRTAPSPTAPSPTAPSPTTPVPTLPVPTPFPTPPGHRHHRHPFG